MRSYLDDASCTIPHVANQYLTGEDRSKKIKAQLYNTNSGLPLLAGICHEMRLNIQYGCCVMENS